MPGYRYRRAIAFAAVHSLPALFLSANAATQTSVYRCTSGDGAVEFRQLPCAGGSDEESLVIEDRKTGWTPGPSGTSAKRKTASKPRKRTNTSAAKGSSSQARKAEQCWKKRQLLEEVNWKLRRGYKASQGVKLRRRRQTYEDYIGRYCE